MSLQRVLLSTLLAIGLQQVAFAETSKIAGGANAKENQFRYQALIMENGDYKCGGSIINRRTILTAASCVPNKDDPFSYTIILGDLNKDGNDGTEQAYVPIEIIHKEEFNSTTRENDIALLILYSNIDFNDHVNEIRIAEPNSEWYLDKEGTVSGWGGGEGEGVLKNGAASIKKTTDECSADYHDVTDQLNILCVVSGACSKDHGGPLTSSTDGKTIQVGIASTLKDCQDANDKSFGLFTEIAHYTTWIDSKIGDVDTGAGHVSRISESLMVFAAVVMILMLH